MKKNLDRDIIDFHNESSYEEGTDVSTGKKSLYVKYSSGPICEKYNCNVGSKDCIRCPHCYGVKVRWWTDSFGSVSTDGYIKCSSMNDTFVNKLKCFWWKFTGRKVVVKDLENE